jgi:hypothetical protein
VEEGGRPVGEVAGVRTVHREAPVGPGDCRSDPSTWMASVAVGVDGGRWLRGGLWSGGSWVR